MIRTPLLRPRPSTPRTSGIADRCDCVRQIYGLSATRLDEPVRCVTEEDQNMRRAVDWFSRRPGRIVDCALNGKTQETPSG